MKEKKEKLMTIYWSVSMAFMGVSTLVSAVTNLLGLPLPDAAVRILGVVQILSLVSLAVSTVTKFRSAAKKTAELAEKGVKHET